MDTWPRIVSLTDASGARWAAEQGMLVVIVDVIDMSTTLEAALEAGALAVLGASPDVSRAPVALSPENIGRDAAVLAKNAGASIIVISEPRVGSDMERRSRCQRLLDGINTAGGQLEAVIPNLGAETPRLAPLEKRIVIAATDTGGVAYDAAYQIAPNRVTIGTVARTLKMRGREPVQACLARCRQLYDSTGADGIAVVAASKNSLEDVLAANYIAQQMIMGF